MSAIQQLLTEHLDIWTEADTGPKSGRGRSSANAAKVYGISKLRELILQLAIEGHLVTKSRGKWSKCTLDDVGEWGSGGTPVKTHPEYYGGDIPWLIIGDLNDGVVTKAETYITTAGLKNSSAKLVPSGSLLIAMYGSIGKLGIAGMDCATNQAIAFCMPNQERVLTKYLFIYLMAVRANLLARGQGLAQQNISQKILKSFPISLPSLNEQSEIIDKADELMALCDQLEAKHNNSTEAHEKLVSHLLGTLTQSQSAEDFGVNWQRIAAHFDSLFTTEASIDALKKTLLQLAVMGKLVPQDPNDEPASELLKRIQAEKAKLVAEGRIKKEKPLLALTDEEKPFPLKKTWAWIRLGDLVRSSGSGWSPSCEGRPRSGNEWGVLKVSAVSWGEFLPNENKALPANLEARPEHEVINGDFLVSRANTAELVARSVIAENPPNRLMLSDKIVRLNLVDLCDKRFVNLTNSAASSRRYYGEVAGGTSSSMKNVTREQILNLAIPLPPLAEQSRIVTKVYELMTLCDQLKSRLTEAGQLQQKLADVLVANAVSVNGEKH